MRTYQSLKSMFAFSAVLLAVALPARADMFGDVNGDGLFNVADATTTLQISVGAVTPNAAQVRAADVAPVNGEGVFGDNSVNVADAIRLLQKIVGTDTTPNWPGVRSIHDQEPGPTGGVPLPKFFEFDVKADTNREVQLSGGFKLSGKLNGGTGTLGLLFWDEGRKVSVSDTPDATARNYAVGLPAGNYKAYVNFFVQNGFSTTTLHVPTGETVGVSEDTTRDFTAPAMPQLFTVQGTIAAPAGVTPPFSFSIEQIKDANGNDLDYAVRAVAGSFTIDGTYSVQLPVGTYKARFTLMNDGGGFSAIDGQETFVVAGNKTQNLSAPPLVTLSGTVTGAGGGGLPAGTTRVNLISSDILARNDMGIGTVMSGEYALPVPVGSYNLSLTHTPGQGGEDPEIEAVAPDSWSYQIGSLNLPGDTVRNLTFPALPAARVRLTGKALGPDGKAITKGSIMVSGSALVGADPKLGYLISQDLTTTGAYDLNVPPGRYRVTVSPDPGFPVAFDPNNG